VNRNSLWLSLACVATFASVIVLYKDDGAGTGTQFPVPVEPGAKASAPPSGSVTMVRTGPRPPLATPPRADDAAEASNDQMSSSLTPLYSGDADARAAAIADVDDAAATPQSLSVLEQTVRFDEVSRNRILAVDLLRRLAQHGDESGRTAALLHLALADADPNVVTNARDALREVER
jgi:hypothetical protein